MIVGEDYRDSGRKLRHSGANKQFPEEILCERFEIVPQLGELSRSSMDHDDGQSTAAEAKGAIRSPPSTILVTGASGFVGSAIAAALRDRGHAVRVLARASSPRTNLNPTDVVCEGDLRDRASLAAALKGARYLFHAAADYRLWARDPEEIRRSNIEGTRLIMQEALSAGVERIVYTSSVATLKLADGAAATEDHPSGRDRGDRRLQAQQGRR